MHLLPASNIDVTVIKRVAAGEIKMILLKFVFYL